MTRVATSAAGDTPRPRRVNSPAAVVQSSGLPPQLADLVLGVTGKCRLWKHERTEVARELCAHFADGLEFGASPGELAESFGDSRSAARLISSATRRKRPLWWRASRATLRITGCFLLVFAVFYGVLAARFFLARPTIKHNYLVEMNAPVLAIPASSRARPLYLQAMLEFGKLPEFMMADGTSDARRIGDNGWDQMVGWIGAHETAFATLRLAASKPAHGYVYRSSLDPDYGRILEATREHYTYDPTSEREVENPLIIGVLLPHLGHLRGFGRWLDADARLAIQNNDPSRCLADIDAILGMAQQCYNEPIMICALVGLALNDLALGPALDAAAQPGFLSDAQLRDLAHRLAGAGGGHIRLDASYEGRFIEDVLQRFFTDDGRGGGRFIGATAEIESMYRDFGVARPAAYPLIRAFQPIQSVILPSRATLSRRVREFVAAAAVDDSLPPWRHDERSSDVLWSEILHTGISTVFPMIESLTSGGGSEGPIASACASRDIFQTKRDAVLVALAMECYRREHGAWPASLEAMVPSLLPAVPLDPFDGRPLRFRPAPPRADITQRPLLYSIGADQTDDGGKLTTTKAARSGVHHLHRQRAFRKPGLRTVAEEQQLDAVRGDWILWPAPPAVAEGK